VPALQNDERQRPAGTGVPALQNDERQRPAGIGVPALQNDERQRPAGTGVPALQQRPASPEDCGLFGGGLSSGGPPGDFLGGEGEAVVLCHEVALGENTGLTQEGGELAGLVALH